MHTAPLIFLNVGVRRMAEQAWVTWHGTGAATYEVDNGGTLVFADAFPRSWHVPRDGLVVWLDAADSATVEMDGNGESETGASACADAPALIDHAVLTFYSFVSLRI